MACKIAVEIQDGLLLLSVEFRNAATILTILQILPNAKCGLVLSVGAKRSSAFYTRNMKQAVTKV